MVSEEELPLPPESGAHHIPGIPRMEHGRGTGIRTGISTGRGRVRSPKRRKCLPGTQQDEPVSPPGGSWPDPCPGRDPRSGSGPVFLREHSTQEDICEDELRRWRSAAGARPRASPLRPVRRQTDKETVLHDHTLPSKTRSPGTSGILRLLQSHRLRDKGTGHGRKLTRDRTAAVCPLAPKRKQKRAKEKGQAEKRDRKETEKEKMKLETSKGNMHPQEQQGLKVPPLRLPGSLSRAQREKRKPPRYGEVMLPATMGPDQSPGSGPHKRRHR